MSSAVQQQFRLVKMVPTDVIEEGTDLRVKIDQIENLSRQQADVVEILKSWLEDRDARSELLKLMGGEPKEEPLEPPPKEPELKPIDEPTIEDEGLAKNVWIHLPRCRAE